LKKRSVLCIIGGVRRIGRARCGGGSRREGDRMKENSVGKTLSRACYLVIRALVKLFSPRFTVEGTENLPDGPCIVVGNHSQMFGPIASELYFPGERAIWCAGEMFRLRDVPEYAYRDFWWEKPKSTQWFYRILSYIIAPIAVVIFNNAHTIPVYRDARGASTFRTTVRRLEAGARVIIFPECAERREDTHIVNVLQDKFVDVARLYAKRTGKSLSFVPMYVAPRLGKLCIGGPTEYDAAADAASERARICEYLTEEITALAVGLPEHTVVPYNNISKKDYPKNGPLGEGKTLEKTGR